MESVLFPIDVDSLRSSRWHASMSEVIGQSTRLRLWPAVLIVATQAAIMLTDVPFGRNRILHAWILLLIWWLFFSRVPWKDRLGGVLIFGVCGLVPRLMMHRSMDYVIFKNVVPTVTAALVLAWLVVSRMRWVRRRWVGLAAATLVFFGWNLVRVDGVTGDMVPLFAYRWADSPEQRFLTQLEKSATPTISQQGVLEPIVNAEAADWPGFRGRQRNSHVGERQLHGAKLRHWQQQLPRELWRQRVGPAWSSCAVVGDRLYTQEQRDQFEAVTCYRLETGEELWSRQDEARFAETIGGIGPRATPTFTRGRIVTVGAEGLVNCLDAGTGDLVWQHSMAPQFRPPWGFSGSPLSIDDLVYVYGCGEGEHALQALSLESGAVVWTAGDGATSYSSPQAMNLASSACILMLSATGLEAFSASSDTLWRFPWDASRETEARIVQPCRIGDDGLVFGSESELIRIQVGPPSQSPRLVETVWRSRQLKPDFNDSVVDGNTLYGFDGSILCAIDLATGKRCWRKRGYGKGQLLLVENQQLLGVLSEQGEFALVSADPAAFEEIVRFSVLSGKTWNHPVIAQGHLIVRNADEMACYRLANESAD